MKVGLFFGSFNPPHIGHTVIAEYMLQHSNAGEIWMVVTPQNPFKDQKELLDEKERLRLVKRALDGNNRILACDFEFDLPRPSYTIDTMKALELKHPDKEFFIILGSDNILGIEGWKDFDKLIEKYDILIYPRKGHEISDEAMNDLGGKVRMTEAPIIDVSSTAIRDSISEGTDCRYMMREAVWRAVKRKGFYQ